MLVGLPPQVRVMDGLGVLLVRVVHHLAVDIRHASQRPAPDVGCDLVSIVAFLFVQIVGAMVRRQYMLPVLSQTIQVVFRPRARQFEFVEVLIRGVVLPVRAREEFHADPVQVQVVRVILHAVRPVPVAFDVTRGQ